jgi:hypothetical protein
MQDFLVTALMFIGLAHLICGRVWFWSRTIPHPRLGPVLRWSALAWSGLLTAIFLAALFATSTCDGSLLSGLGPCRALSADQANALVSLVFLAVAVGMTHVLVLLSIVTVLEWRKRPYF